MATKLYLTNTASDLTAPGGEEYLLLDVGVKGGGISTGTADTVTGGAGTTIELTRDTTNDVILRWWTMPLDAVTIAGDWTVNLWSAESNMNANVQAGFTIDIYDSTGTTVKTSGAWSSTRGTEMAVTTRSVWNLLTNTTDRTLAQGDRLRLTCQGAAIGTMASGHTFNFSFAGTTDAADGDSWWQTTETITEAAIAALDETDFIIRRHKLARRPPRHKAVR